MKSYIKTSVSMFLICAMGTPGIEASDASQTSQRLETLKARKIRIAHVKELLGKNYHGGAVRSANDIEKINQLVRRWTRDALPKNYRKRSRVIAQAILDEANKREFDPVFLLSVIMHESRFVPTVIGSYGEIGLMQLKPSTAQWIAAKTGLQWKGSASLKDPVTNIKLGSAYLSYLRERFGSHARLYIAAYNMGSRNVKSALERNVWPREYPGHVMAQYMRFYSEAAH